jgi:hypothetical protein
MGSVSPLLEKLGDFIKYDMNLIPLTRGNPTFVHLYFSGTSNTNTESVQTS